MRRFFWIHQEHYPAVSQHLIFFVPALVDVLIKDMTCITSIMHWCIVGLSDGLRLLPRWSWRSCAVSSGSGAWHCCDPAGSVWCPPQWKAPRTARHLRHQRQVHCKCRASDLCKLRTWSRDLPLAALLYHNQLSARHTSYLARSCEDLWTSVFKCHLVAVPRVQCTNYVLFLQYYHRRREMGRGVQCWPSLL